MSEWFLRFLATRRFLQSLAVLNMVAAAGLLVAGSLMPTGSGMAPLVCDASRDDLSKSFASLKMLLLRDPAERAEGWEALQRYREMASRTESGRLDRDMELSLMDSYVSRHVGAIEGAADFALDCVDSLSERSNRSKWLFRIAHAVLIANAVLLLFALMARDMTVGADQETSDSAQPPESQ